MSNTMYFNIIPSPLGDILLAGNDQGISLVNFEQGQLAVTLPTHAKQNSFKLLTAEQQITEYFAGKRQQFQLPLCWQGTEFQQQVWQQLTQVPFATTQSYAWLAQQIQRPKAVRAVGAANGKNRIAIIVPCHRIIASNGKLTGYAGGLDIKAKLLAHEQKQING